MPDFKVILQLDVPQLVVGSLQGGTDSMARWANEQVRFPNRRVDALAAHRQLEHRAVDLALEACGGSLAEAQIDHAADGKPQISGQPDRFISLAHHTAGDRCFVVVCVAPHPVGCDLEAPRAQLARIAPRFLSAAENRAVGEDLDGLCAVWATKEAMFKAHGPALDFRTQLHVSWNGVQEALDRGIAGSVKGTPQMYRAWRMESGETPGERGGFWVVWGPEPPRHV